MTRLRSRDLVLTQVQSTKGLAPRIAEACGVRREAVWNWKRIPVAHVFAIEELLGIPRHKIRPDIYPAPDSALAKRWLSNGKRKSHGSKT